jgi:hypothetical protein
MFHIAVPNGSQKLIAIAKLLECGRSSMAERQLPKLHTRVRFPSPAPRCQQKFSKAIITIDVTLSLRGRFELCAALPALKAENCRHR